MTITIPSGRTLPLQAKSGGGFASSALDLGGDPLPEGFQITNYADTQQVLEVAAPRPDAEMGSGSAYRYAHTEMDYSRIVAVFGGKGPFSFELTAAPTGMTITRKAPTWNPNSYTYARIDWPQSSVSAAGAGPHTVTIKVTDQVGATDEVSYPLTVDDSKFFFCDASQGVAGDGSYANPFIDISDWYTSRSDTTYKGMIGVYRAGTYNTLVDAGSTPNSNGECMHFKDGNGPLGQLAFRRGGAKEAVVWDLSSGHIECYRISGGFNTGLYFDGIDFIDPDSTVPNGRGFMFLGGCDQWCVTDSNVSGLPSGTGGSGNVTFFFNDATANYPCLIDVHGSNWTLAGVNGGSVFDNYKVNKGVFDDISAQNITTENVFWAKSDNEQVTYRNLDGWTTNSSTHSLYLSNGTGDGSPSTGLSEVSYSRLYKVDEAGFAGYLGDNDPFGTISVYRCTLLGKVDNIAPANGDVILDYCTVVNDASPIIGANIETVTNNDTYTRAASPLETDGGYPDGNANRYVVGYEVEAPA